MQVVANLAHPWRIMIFSKNRFPLFGIMLLAAGCHSGFAGRAIRLFQPFAFGKKIDRANPAASGGIEFYGRGPHKPASVQKFLVAAR
jgi:hypothetical protein